MIHPLLMSSEHIPYFIFISSECKRLWLVCSYVGMKWPAGKNLLTDLGSLSLGISFTYSAVLTK